MSVSDIERGRVNDWFRLGQTLKLTLVRVLVVEGRLDKDGVEECAGKVGIVMCKMLRERSLIRGIVSKSGEGVLGRDAR